mmetsp:Transcript_87580/g.195825  ORF Transcript_87580/g.195825 Transcript_87580/m.195825 type:complete len:347 (-) Transcript_87580:137-1177(-)
MEATQLPPATPGRRRKEESIMGMAMSRTLNGSFGSTRLTGGPELLGEPSPPASPRAPLKLDVSDRLVERYAKQVRKVEETRLMTYVPLDQRETVNPCERAMMRTVKRDLDTVLKQTGSEVIGWEAITNKEAFTKQLQFLHSHAKTGTFVEQYGADGRFEGEFLHGMRHGKGTHEFRGEVYQGDWKWDKRHGWGTLTLADGSQIKGEWEAGKPHGYSCIVDPRGTVTYEGEFRDGKRHGLGRQIFDSGDMYDGGWKEGMLHDRGVYYFTNGDKLYGMWSEGKYDGVGVFHYADGSISRRVYKDGVLMSVQDFEHSSQRFGKRLSRDGMQLHTAHEKFPKEIFMLSTV